MRNSVLVFFLFLLIASCKEADDPIQQMVESYDVLVLNEGNFRSANASLSLYSSETNEVLEKVFHSNNSGRPLGDVAQSFLTHNGKGFIVVNNSNKIEVVNLSDFKSIGKIDGLNSPRYILPVGGDKAYVSDLYEDEIYVVDLESLAILKKIRTDGWTEEMVLVADKAFVTQVDSNQVLVFDVNTDTLISKIETSIAPMSIALDINQRIWIGCTGGLSMGKPALMQIDPNSFQILKKMEIQNINASIGSLEFNASKDKLFFLNTDLYRIDIQDSVLPNMPYIRSNNRNFYAYGINPFNDEIYISDAIDFQQNGVIYRYNSNAQEIGNFYAGLIPGFIDFLP